MAAPCAGGMLSHWVADGEEGHACPGGGEGGHACPRLDGDGGCPGGGGFEETILSCGGGPSCILAGGADMQVGLATIGHDCPDIWWHGVAVGGGG